MNRTGSLRQALAAVPLLASTTLAAAGGQRVAVSVPASLGPGPFDGRLLLILAVDDKTEPRMQVSDTSLKTAQVFGLEADALPVGREVVFDAATLGYPFESLRDVPKGTYFAQALLHRYETFRRADGHVVKLPMDRSEGQHWNLAPGNLFSKPVKIALDPSKDETVRITLDSAIPPIAPPKDTKWVKHLRMRSEKLSRFWGRDMELGAHVLLPAGFDEHPNARYPLVIFHGHFPKTLGGFREEPPDPDLKPDYSERFGIEGYNRIVQKAAHDFHKEWTGPGFPRVLLVELQHPNPYYDDSYAVNSENLGPYGDAITYELIPEIERRFRGIGQGWARFLYGGSTGGWEALAAQVFYPDEFNGCWAACPDPVDFRAYTTVNLYEDRNAYVAEGPFKKVGRPVHRNWLGHVSATLEQANRMELVLGTKSRSGQQFDIWEAVYSPVGKDGYPKRIWDKRTGEIDRDVASFWRDRYDLSHILARDWEKGLGEKLRGKVHVYVGDMDNYYLNNAVYLLEERLAKAKNPPYEGEVRYGDRAEHCWNGDPTRPNALSRLRYHQLYLPKILERIAKSAPPGADESWKY